MAKQYGSNERLALGIASLQGASACYGDLPIEANPHEIGSPAFKAWNEAWQFAFQQSVKEFLDSRASLAADVELKPALKIVSLVRK